MSFSVEELLLIKIALELAIKELEYGCMGSMEETRIKMRLIVEKIEKRA